MKKSILPVFAVCVLILTGCTYLQTSNSSHKSSTITKKHTSSKLLYDQRSKLSLHVELKHLLALKSIKQLDDYITVLDQNGNQVTHLPVINGQVSIAMQFMPKILDLKYSEEDVPISVVIYQVCSILQHDIRYKSVKSEINESKDVEDLVIEGISWNSNTNSISFQFTNES